MLQFLFELQEVVFRIVNLFKRSKCINTSIVYHVIKLNVVVKTVKIGQYTSITKIAPSHVLNFSLGCVEIALIYQQIKNYLYQTISFILII